MGIIREPKGVDFVVQSPALSEKDKKEISDFIKSRKRINERKTGTTKSRTKTKASNSN